MSLSSSDTPFSDAEAGAPSRRPPSSGTAVGISESQYSTKQRQLLDLINKLHNTGIQSEIDLPQICVIGSQSAGKSSLIESISGITLPRSAGTCTRFLKDGSGSDINPVRNVPFGQTMYSPSEIEDRIRRAQLAILAPNEDSVSFLALNLKSDPVPSGGVAFSENYISVEISGPDVTNLSFCDLPGMIANVREGHDEGDIELVKQMIESYIKKPSCIILLTVTCETDFENQGARKLAKEYDPDGKRTIGVLTKPDRIEPGEEDKWLSFIRDETETLKQGWFCVKQPSPAELAENLAWKETRKREDTFFNTREPWKSQPISVKRKFGTVRLTNHLSDILSDLILTRLPSIQSEIHSRLQKTTDELKQLPEEISDDPTGSLVGILVAFGREVSRSVEGIPGAGGLMHQLRMECTKFRNAIRQTAPSFRPYNRKQYGDDVEPPLPNITFLLEDPITNGKGIVYYDDDIAQMADEAITRELPRNAPFIVKRQLIGEVIELWRGPIEHLLEGVKRLLTEHIRSLTEARFSQYEYGGLHSTIWGIVSDRIGQHFDKAENMIRFLYQLEKEQTFTLDDRYLADYKEKFKAYYSAAKRQHHSVKKSNFLSGLAKGVNDSYVSGPKNNISRTPTAFAQNLALVISKLSEMGVSVSPLELGKLIETDSAIESLDVISEVQAYYHISYKRFVDTICMTADQALVRAFSKDLDMYLCKSLGTSGENAREKCAAFLANSNEVRLAREVLSTRRDRLVAAKNEVLLLWSV